MRKNRGQFMRKLAGAMLALCLLAAASFPAFGASEEKPDGTDTLTVEEYDLLKTGSSRERVDVLCKKESAALVVTLRSESLMTEDIKKSDISIRKEKDSYRISGSPSVKIISKKEDNLTFQIRFSKITYNGKAPDFGFQVKYKGTGMESIPVHIDITEAEESSGGRDSREDGTGQPVIRVERVGELQPVQAGEKIELKLRVTNTSRDSDVEDLTVSMNPDPALYLLDQTNSVYVKRLDTGESREIHVHMQVGPELSGASLSLEVESKFSYSSSGGLTSGTCSQKIMVPVKGNSALGQPLLDISHVGDPGVVRAGQEFTTVVRIQNTSQNRAASNLVMTVEPGEQIGLGEPEDTRLLGELGPGQAAEVPIRLKAAGELSQTASQMVGISLKFEYDGGKGAVQAAASEKIVIHTQKSGGKCAVPTPNIIVRNYSYGGEVTAGQVFDLEMEIANTSASVPAENILMTLDTGEGLSINSSSNTIYIPSLAPSAAETKQVKVQALFQSKLQSPKMEISFKYEYMDQGERKQNSTAEKIAIPVYQPDRLEIQTPELGEEVRVNEETAISIPYVNKGRGQIYNVEAKLQGEVDALQKNLNLGNFESGKSGTIDFIVTPRQEGTFEGSVKLIYEDEAANVKELEIPVQFEALPEEIPDFSQEEEFKNAEKNKGFPWIFLGGGAAAALTGGFWALRNKRKKAQEFLTETQEEEWQDE